MTQISNFLLGLYTSRKRIGNRKRRGQMLGVCLSPKDLRCPRLSPILSPIPICESETGPTSSFRNVRFKDTELLRSLISGETVIPADFELYSAALLSHGRVCLNSRPTSRRKQPISGTFTTMQNFGVI